MSEIPTSFLFLALGGLFGFAFGHFFGWNSNQNAWEKECIERGHAQYNVKTGDWEWIEDTKAETPTSNQE